MKIPTEGDYAKNHSDELRCGLEESQNLVGTISK